MLRLLTVCCLVFAAGFAGCVASAPTTTTPTATPTEAVPDFGIEATEPEPAYEPNIPGRDAGFARDREAILMLAGGYRVDYRFEETAALRPGVEVTPPYTASAVEWVVVAQDTGERVVLQHLLVMGEPARIVKHWHQTWDYAPSSVLRYVDEDTWRMQDLLSPGQLGRWSRTVSEADGAPSYGAWGRWTHGETTGSQWAASTAVLAPPPRRDGLRREAYQAVLIRDRVRVLDDGWLQQSVSTKRFINDNTPGLARESGVVRYRRIDDEAERSQAFAAAARYWRDFGPFWDEARRAWDDWFADGVTVRLRSEVEGQPRWRRMFDLAAQAGERRPTRPLASPQAGRGTAGEALREQIEAALADYVIRP